MGLGKCLLCVIFFLVISISSRAQDRYAVYYKFKPQDNLSLDEPQEFLSTDAIARRAKEGIVLDSLDLPVAKKYVAELELLSEYILYDSKWLNATILVTDEARLNTIREFPFVEKVEYLAPGFLTNPNSKIGERRSSSKTTTDFNIENKRKLAINENPYDFQNDLIGIRQMHDEGFRGSGIKIAVFDAGFPGVETIPSFDKLFSNDQLLATADIVRPWIGNVFTDNQHGTNVLSLIAADDPDLLQGGAPDAEFVLVITEDDNSEYRIEEYNWVRGAEFADSLGVDIIQSSVGYWDFDDPSMNYTVEDMDGNTAIISIGAQKASDKGILVINSSGNYGSGESSLVAPADAKGVLAIGSVNSNLEVSGFSSRGPTGDGRLKPALATYGAGVALLRSNGSLGFANGTSFSAPQITSLAAGLMQARPEWSKEQLVENLLRSGNQAENPDNILGYGIPNFMDAYFGEILSLEDPEEVTWKVYPNPVSGDILSIFLGNELNVFATLLNSEGKLLIEAELSRDSIKKPFKLIMKETIPGFYILHLRDGKTLRKFKIIKK